MIDPYAKINERIRAQIRAHARSARFVGRSDDDVLIQRVSEELGDAADKAFGVICEAIEEFGLRYLEELSARGALTRNEWFAASVRGARFATAGLRGAGGRVVRNAAEATMRGGLSFVRDMAAPIVDAVTDVANARGTAPVRRMAPAKRGSAPARPRGTKKVARRARGK